MELHKQLTSPELSNKLKDLSINEPSSFWRDYRGSKPGDIEYAANFEPYYCEDNVNCYSAVDLGELLPASMWNDERTVLGALTISKSDDKGNTTWVVSYHSRDEMFFAKSEADARAKMLIYLIEKKLIKLPSQQ